MHNSTRVHEVAKLKKENASLLTAMTMKVLLLCSGDIIVGKGEGRSLCDPGAEVQVT